MKLHSRNLTVVYSNLYVIYIPDTIIKWKKILIFDKTTHEIQEFKCTVLKNATFVNILDVNNLYFFVWSSPSSNCYI